MERKDWLCPECWDVMTSSQCGRFMVCVRCWAPMKMRWAVKDLPLARRVDYKRFMIVNHYGYYEYVPHAHKGCMGRAPEAETVVARVEYVGKYSYSDHRPMTFRPCKTPRIKK